MSNALAIAGVTAVMRDLLDSGLIDHEITDTLGQGVTVSALAPDLVRIEGADARPQLNLFLHQVTPNAAWRNTDLPSRGRNGERLRNPPLALDLHYLVTAYGATDLQAEVLLGYAMQLFHETPVPSRDAIRTALNPPNAPVTGGLLPAVFQALRASELADQYEQIKITPAPMNTEEMSKLWSAIQSHYRPTAAYQVSVVLIESRRPARAPLPVLTRGPRVPSQVDPAVSIERGVGLSADMLPPFPAIDEVTLPNKQIAAHLGDAITVSGHHLDGTAHALILTLPKLGIERTLAPLGTPTASSATFTLQNAPADFPAGGWLVALQVVRPGETAPRTSNQVLVNIAPLATSLTSPPQVFTAVGGTAVVTISCTPQVQPRQRASLILGTREFIADPHPNATSNLAFTIADAPVGTHHVRLRVDAVDSQLVDRSASPPVFFDQRIEIA